MEIQHIGEPFSIDRADAYLKTGNVVVFGGGVAAMHYIGLAAFQTQGRVEWDSLLVAVSIALGMGVSILALLAADRARTLKRQMAGAAVLTLAICLLHFTGMGAATIIPDPSIRVPPQLLSGAVLTFAVASIISRTAGRSFCTSCDWRFFVFVLTTTGTSLSRAQSAAGRR